MILSNRTLWLRVAIAADFPKSADRPVMGIDSLANRRPSGMPRLKRTLVIG